jgi:hypothetical protein
MCHSCHCDRCVYLFGYGRACEFPLGEGCITDFLIDVPVILALRDMIKKLVMLPQNHIWCDSWRHDSHLGDGRLIVKKADY